MPAIIDKLKFIDETNRNFSNENFSGYLNYIGRENATDRNKNLESFNDTIFNLENDFSLESKEKKFSGYLNYAGRTNATDKEKNIVKKKRRKQSKALHSSFFTSDSDSLSEIELEELKSSFDLAQKNKSVLWEIVYSFDNNFLEEQGLLNQKTKELDEIKIKEAIRKAMNYSIENLNIKESALWSANIHYDTDNIHIHIGMCEPNPTRSRGYIPKKIKNNMKSKVINHLLNFDEEYKEINKIIRTDLAKSVKDNDIYKDMKMRRLINDVIKNLPSDSRHWHYRYNTMKPANQYLDKLTEYYIYNYRYDEFKDLIDKLDKQEEKIKHIYGENSKSYKDYKKNKIDELYVRMGNTFLSEIKEVLKEEKEKYNKNNTNINMKRKTIITKSDVKKIGKALGDELDNIKNQEKFKELEKKIEYDL